MSIIGNLFAGGIQGIAKAGTRVYTAVAGDQVQKDQQYHTEQMATSSAYISEFAAPEKKGIFNSLVDGANRLVRPIYTYNIIGMLWWAVIDPVQFTTAMVALAIVPDMLWGIFFTVTSFWFGGRFIKDWRGNKIDATKQLETLKNLQKIQGKIGGEASYQNELSDTSKPLTNSAILEWNRRRQDNK